MANRLITQVESQNALLGAVVANFMLNKLDRILEYKDADEVTVKGSNRIILEINDKWFYIDTDTDLSTGSDLDTGAVAAGTDYYVYACDNAGTLVFLISAASTFPSGYSADTSRKIGGFHTLCAAVDHETNLTAWAADTVIAVGETRKATSWDGYMYRCVAVAGDEKTHAATEPVWSGISVGDTIVDDQVTWIKEEHALEGAAAADILEHSVWDLKHRARCGANEGMVYDERTGLWVDIYLASGTGASTVSANGGTISDTRNWMDFVDDGAAVNKRLLRDPEFQSIAKGSNEETDITGSADPVTTGGHSDTAGRRMVSDIGCEDCCGALWQWLETPASRADFNIGDDTGDEDDVHGWEDLSGYKGSLYTYGENGYWNTQLLAGGVWSTGASCGSRCRHASGYRWAAAAGFGARFASEPL